MVGREYNMRDVDSYNLEFEVYPEDITKLVATHKLFSSRDLSGEEEEKDYKEMYEETASKGLKLVERIDKLKVNVVIWKTLFLGLMASLVLLAFIFKW